MILFFLAILVVFGVIGFISLDNYPSFLLNGIFEKCQKEQFSFLQKSFIFLNPTNIDEHASVLKYFTKLKKYLNRSENDVKPSFLFKIQTIKSKKEPYPTHKLNISLKFSLGGDTHIEKIEFHFIRYNWWRWTLLDCKELTSGSPWSRYHSLKNGYDG